MRFLAILLVLFVGITSHADAIWRRVESHSCVSPPVESDFRTDVQFRNRDGERVVRFRQSEPIELVMTLTSLTEESNVLCFGSYPFEYIIWDFEKPKMLSFPPGELGVISYLELEFGPHESYSRVFDENRVKKGILSRYPPGRYRIQGITRLSPPGMVHPRVREERFERRSGFKSELLEFEIYE